MRKSFVIRTLIYGFLSFLFLLAIGSWLDGLPPSLSALIGAAFGLASLILAALTA